MPTPNAQRKANHAAALARYRVRLYDPATKTYLHMGGEKCTDVAAWSWSGLAYQADNIKRRWIMEGRGWPFVVVSATEEAKETQ